MAPVRSKGETYVARLIHEYATPVDVTLAPLLTGYAENMVTWAAIFLKYGAFCAEPGFTEQRGAAKRSGELGAMASTARQTLPVEVAAGRR